MTGLSIGGGRYRLEREIARGGMGAIWAAFDTQLQRRVALKLMNPDHGAPFVLQSRFRREAYAVAQLNHPNVVQIYDAGVEAGAPYLVMELLDGEDLDARLRRLRRLPLAVLSPIVDQAARGLAAAHDKDIVHRDLKPANVFLARVDGNEAVKVLDFGVSVFADASLGIETPRGLATSLVGTPHYMSPEQARRSKLVDRRSDLWSLAVVAYRALVGRLPFEGGGPVNDLIVAICNTDPPRPSSLVPELGPDVDRFFERALAKDPEKRFQTARDLARALAQVAGLEQEDRGRAKILVVDDEPDVEELVLQRFRRKIRAGTHEFLFARDGEAALGVIREHPDVDAVLTDINMPRMDGITLLGRVTEARPGLKVVVVSAYGDMPNIRAAMNRGAFDFLTKPIDFADLEVTLDKTLRQVQEAKRTRRREEENQFLRMFVGDQLLARVLPTTRAADTVRSETVEGTVAFIAVHGITPVVESHLRDRPETAVRRLNANLEVIVAEVTARSGGVDKFMGDMLMVVFSGDDHLQRALEACVAIRDQLSVLSRQPDGDEADERSDYAHGVSIGLDSGTMLFGPVGSRLLCRLDYTVLGEVVNTAARLQRHAPRGEILVPEAVYERVRSSFACSLRGTDLLPGAPMMLTYYRVERRMLTELEASNAATSELTGELSGEITMMEERRREIFLDPKDDPIDESRPGHKDEPSPGPKDPRSGNAS